MGDNRIKQRGGGIIKSEKTTKAYIGKKNYEEKQGGPNETVHQGN